MIPQPSSAEAEAEPDRAGPGPHAAPESPDLGALPDLVGYALRRTQIAVFNRFRRSFAAYDIRPGQLGVLTVIHHNPGLKQSEVSAALGIKRTNFGPLLERLIARGLVRRARLASDRRAFALHLSPDGEDLVRQLYAREVAFEEEISALIGEAGRRHLLDLLAKVAATCEEDAEGPEPA